MLDACGCCQVCARSLGQHCDLTPDTTDFGKCGEFLQCRQRTDIGVSCFLFLLLLLDRKCEIRLSVLSRSPYYKFSSVRLRMNLI